MTDLNNSNDDEERPNDASHGGGSPMDDLDAAWAEFADSHADDLKAVERSRSAKRFEKHAQRREKEALLSIDDLDQGTFTNDAPANGRGPRDFTGSSWLDTDRVMDRYGDDFVPPNPEIGHVKLSKLVFWILLVAGVIGIIASVFVPALASILGSIFGLCALVGAAGLIVQHKGHRETRNDEFDDGLCPVCWTLLIGIQGQTARDMLRNSSGVRPSSRIWRRLVFQWMM